MKWIFVAAPLLFSTAAPAQVQEKKDDTLKKAGSIATQPARDVGIDKDKIPQVLQRAVEDPYGRPASRSCKNLKAALDELNAVLGPDFTVGQKANENRTGKIAEAVGKTIVNSIIPFRGLVREISGAAPAERRLEAAVTAGIARRGYLRGIAAERGCKIMSPPPTPQENAEDAPRK
ncbi:MULTISPECIES: hypothetical protein [unclassified Sphingobium]|uniref:hypothetical protein n=1 Tax=unclassified Sphingobium TaxID=2611147 RepID=UPI0007706C22|nr:MULTISPECIES: hypothetical protein [unclassified Sphingobium]AMK25028.1 hypothetical protein K426_20495 [Sphingobium sp. TKS]NML90532.1 hypothetical protein [Sphingobium sp. TB-6]